MLKNRKKTVVITCIVVVVVALAATATMMLKLKNVNKPETKVFSAYFFANGYVLNDDNDMQKAIEKITGAKCVEEWSNGISKEEIISEFVVEGEYPDFISGCVELYDVNALIPLDDYIEKYPNIKNYLSEENWKLLRQEDGHIYWIPQFGVCRNADDEFIHDGEAFWIQARVLKWGGYPKITTMDQYFDLIERYVAANPYMEDGVTKNIPYTILCDDWRYFCLENAPQFLDGYPNDGSCMVNPDTLEVMDYNVTPTAKKYFKKLNEEYKKGIVDPESFTSTYDDYLNKLSTGAVLGMIDQRWNYYYDISAAYENRNLDELGCEYVPLPITISPDVKSSWHVKRSSEFSTSSGLAITVSCQDVDGALQFINDLLSDEVMLLRYWGEKDVDYKEDENGYFYVPEEAKGRYSDSTLATSHFCSYSYFPRIEGIMDDGKNNFLSEYQNSVIKDGLSTSLKECLAAYNVNSFVEMLGESVETGPWFPMYSYTDGLVPNSVEGMVNKQIKDVKHTWLPKVVMADNFEETWEEYLKAYQACNPKILFDAMQQEVYRRAGTK